MEFLDRRDELERLGTLTRAPGGGLALLWGRRRVGKTRLLLEWVRASGGTYWVADQSSSEVQRRYLAQQLGSVLPGFGDTHYPDWHVLFARLASDARLRGWRGPLVIDELPYLVGSSPEVASLLQRFVDHDFRQAGLVLALSGSSQRMMQGAALNHDAPLYGRAAVQFALQPLPPWFLRAALGVRSARDVLAAYTVWGGIPRYWELAAAYGTRTSDAATDLVLDPSGTLHEEPQRLLLEDEATHLRAVLDAIGGGAHRLSEIASRIGAKATSLIKPLGQLIELGYVRRELPFGASPRDSKRSLYKIDDPFMRFWFRVVAPRRGALAQLPRVARRRLLMTALPSLLSDTWETLCRRAVPRLAEALGRQYSPAARYWHGSGPEWDVLAPSVDGEYLLVGEAKWTQGEVTAQLVARAARALVDRGPPPTGAANPRVQLVLFVPEKPRGARAVPPGVTLIDAETLVRALGR